MDNIAENYLINVTEISKLQLKPGDILIVKVSGRATKDIRKQIIKYFEDVIPTGANVRIVNDEIFDFMVIEDNGNQTSKD